MRATIDRSIEWMVDHVDENTGEIVLGESTRTCQGETKRIDPAQATRVFLLWAWTEPDRRHLVDLALLMEGRPPTLCTEIVGDG